MKSSRRVNLPTSTGLRCCAAAVQGQNRSRSYHLILKLEDTVRTVLRRSYERHKGWIFAMLVINAMSGDVDTQFFINTSVLGITVQCHYDFPLCLRTPPIPSLDSRRNYSFAFLFAYRSQTCCLSSTHAADFVMSSLEVPPFSISCVPKSISSKISCLPISLSTTVSLF